MTPFDQADGISYKHIIASLPAAVFFTDDAARISFWNETAARLTGLALQDVIGKTFTETGLALYIEGDPNGADRCSLQDFIKCQSNAGEAQTDIFCLIARIEDKVVRFVCRRACIEAKAGIIGVACAEKELCNAGLNLSQEHNQLHDVDKKHFILGYEAFFDALKRDWHRYQRYKDSFSILSVEVDFYTNFMEVFGEKVAAEMMSRVLSCVGVSLRRSDIIGRVAPDRLLILLNNSDRKSALKVADKLLEKLRQEPCGNLPFVTTVSMGAVSVEENQTLDKTLERADSALQRSIDMGRNQVTFWG